FRVVEIRRSGKGVELLKEIAPSVTRVAVLRDPALASGTSQFAVIQAAAPSLRMEVSPINVGDAGEIERAVTAFARSPNAGLIVPAGGTAQLNRNLIIPLTARHKFPPGYHVRFFLAARGRSSFGSHFIDHDPP